MVELGTNEAKSVHEYDNFSLTENFPVFEENDLLKQKPERYEIQEEDSKDEKDDNDVIIYHVDENNFLMDENGIYIYDNENNHMEISVENFEHLRKSYGS